MPEGQAVAFVKSDVGFSRETARLKRRTAMSTRLATQIELVKKAIRKCVYDDLQEACAASEGETSSWEDRWCSPCLDDGGDAGNLSTFMVRDQRAEVSMPPIPRVDQDERQDRRSSDLRHRVRRGRT